MSNSHTKKFNSLLDFSTIEIKPDKSIFICNINPHNMYAVNLERVKDDPRGTVCSINAKNIKYPRIFNSKSHRLYFLYPELINLMCDCSISHFKYQDCTFTKPDVDGFPVFGLSDDSDDNFRISPTAPTMNFHVSDQNIFQSVCRRFCRIIESY